MVLVLLLGVIIGLFVHFDSYQLTALFMTLAMILISHLGVLVIWLRGPALQFIGRISYSLFLIHGTVG
jgi:peptidoglycan/LPS O-acetylase OafA/YrhL